MISVTPSTIYFEFVGASFRTCINFWQSDAFLAYDYPRDLFRAGLHRTAIVPAMVFTSPTVIFFPRCWFWVGTRKALRQRAGAAPASGEK